MREIFVFESNFAGRHGEGAALDALNYHKAIWGQGAGLQGNSYAIPIKDGWLRTLPLSEIQEYVRRFIVFAGTTGLKKEMIFNVTAIGCGLAGYTPEQIAPFFKLALNFDNINLPKEFLSVLLDKEDIKTEKYKIIKNYIKEGKSQTWIGKKLGISQGTVSSYLKRKESKKKKENL